MRGTALKIMKIHGISEIAIQDIVQNERAGLLNTILIIEFKKIVWTRSSRCGWTRSSDETSVMDVEPRSPVV